jgi:2-keto-3-deoxy-6-phosphogluconate aldolase
MEYAKAGAAVVATVLTAIVAVLDGGISAVEWVNVAIAGVTAAAVFAAPNVPGAKYTKSVLAVLGAVLVLLASAIVGGVTTTELLQLVVVALGALGVYALPNRPSAKVVA